MTVAQSNLICSNFITGELVNILKYDSLGYTKVNRLITNLIIEREKYQEAALTEKNITFGISVLALLVHFINSFTKEGEEIIVLSPVYFKFRKLIESNKRICLECELILDEEERYSVDFEKLEELMKRSTAKAIIICNPHNPGGFIWNDENLHKISMLCKKHGIQILSDEIHSDLCFMSPFNSYVLYDENAIVIDSPTKAYNVPSLKIAFALSRNEFYIEKISDEISKSGVGSPGMLEMSMLKSAYSREGEQWLGEFKAHCLDNLKYLQSIVKNKMKKFSMRLPEASYLCWINVGDANDLDLYLKILEKNHGILLSDGREFSKFNETHFRLNCSVDTVTFKEVCEALVKSYKILFP